MAETVFGHGERDAGRIGRVVQHVERQMPAPWPRRRRGARPGAAERGRWWAVTGFDVATGAYTVTGVEVDDDTHALAALSDTDDPEYGGSRTAYEVHGAAASWLVGLKVWGFLAKVGEEWVVLIDLGTHGWNGALRTHTFCAHFSGGNGSDMTMVSLPDALHGFAQALVEARACSGYAAPQTHPAHTAGESLEQVTAVNSYSTWLGLTEKSLYYAYRDTVGNGAFDWEALPDFPIYLAVSAAGQLTLRALNNTAGIVSLVIRGVVNFHAIGEDMTAEGGDGVCHDEDWGTA